MAASGMQRQDYSTGMTPTMVGSPSVGTPSVDPQSMPKIPFRIATMERSDLIQTDVVTMTTGDQLIERTVPGTGFVYGLQLRYASVTSGNSANVAFAEDGPYASTSSVIFRDAQGELINSDHFSLKQVGRYGGWEPFNEESSTDTTIFSKTTGSGGTGGSYTFQLKVPVALNRRTVLGLLGNQDRGQSYILRANLPSGSTGNSGVYSTGPTALGSVTIDRHYESYVVPNAINDQNQQNQQVPPFYGVIPYITKSVSPSVPTGGQTTNHFLQRINTTFRLLLLVLRSNSSRATAESNLPTNIQLQIGNQSVFNELAHYRRTKMWDRYGFDAPSGIFAYDFLHDFAQFAGAELGQDWWWTQNLTEAQFKITYPAGFGSTSNSLIVMTADMTVPTGMNLYAA